MITEKFRTALEEYHRKKWFPEKYRDPFGEFIDYVSEGMITDLIESWKQKKPGSLLDAAYYLFPILSKFRFSEIHSDHRRALSEKLSNEVLPEFAFYYLRTMPEEQSSLLWSDLQQWCDRWETVLSDWCRAGLTFEKDHSNLFKHFHERLGFDADQELRAMEQHLRETRELFAWQIQNQSHAKSLRDLLRYFRLQPWAEIADWNHCTALSKSIAESMGISRLPKLQRSSNPASQFLFAIAPPKRTTLEYGSVLGPLDAIRFLQEFGKGIFYAGMNPNLEIEERICGDPALPWFWGFIVASVLTDSYGIKNFISTGAEEMEKDTALIVEFRHRYEMALALYRNQAETDWKGIQDQYAAWWEIAFPIEPPRVLYLYDLTRGMESCYRANAMKRAKETVPKLRTKYGNQWFRSQKWNARMKDYFWEGYRLTMNDVVRDI